MFDEVLTEVMMEALKLQTLVLITKHKLDYILLQMFILFKHTEIRYILTFDGYLKIIDSDNNEINNYKVEDIKFWNKKLENEKSFNNRNCGV